MFLGPAAIGSVVGAHRSTPFLARAITDSVVDLPPGPIESATGDWHAPSTL